MRMFASQSFAAEIEAAEVSLLREAAGAASAETYLVDLAGGCAAFAYPGSPFNKLCGVGFAGRLPEGALAEVERTFIARGAALIVEVSTLGDPDVVQQLTQRGYQLVGFEAVLGRALDGGAPLQPSAAAEIVPCEKSDFET